MHCLNTRGCSTKYIYQQYCYKHLLSLEIVQVSERNEDMKGYNSV